MAGHTPSRCMRRPELWQFTRLRRMWTPRPMSNLSACPASALQIVAQHLSGDCSSCAAMVTSAAVRHGMNSGTGMNSREACWAAQDNKLQRQLG